MRYSLIILCWILAHSAIAQMSLAQLAKHKTRKVQAKIRRMQKVEFQNPIMVIIRIDIPVDSANYKEMEYKLIMDKSLLEYADTLSLQGILLHPGIYFFGRIEKTLGTKVNVFRTRFYDLRRPITTGRLNTLAGTRISYAQLKNPGRSKFYAVTEPAYGYRSWVVQQNSAYDLYDRTKDILPGIDSVRALYVLESQFGVFPSKRERQRILINIKPH